MLAPRPSTRDTARSPPRMILMGVPFGRGKAAKYPKFLADTVLTAFRMS